jgi:hypothetical protein
MNEDILKAINDLREKVTEIDIKLESMNSELRPFVHLVRGNGRPGLEARLYHTEQKVDDLEKNANWSVKFAISALISAFGTIIWHIVKQ